MIDKTKVIETLFERLEKLPEGHYLDLRTYKRNRSVKVVKLSVAEVLVIEDGYQSESFKTSSDKLRKLMKGLLKKEFPRSNKVRLYVMGRYNEDEAAALRRKII